MAHQWEDISGTKGYVLQNVRRCLSCGAVQSREEQQSWMRVTGYRWFPLAGRCPADKKEKTDAQQG